MAPRTELEEIQELRKDVNEVKILLQAILRNMNVACDTDCNEEISKELPNELSLDTKITSILKRIGISANLMGYAYVKTAISMCVNDPSLVHSVTKTLYPNIAKHYHTTPSRVGRDIMHAIEIAFNRGDIDFINEIFSYTISSSSGKPTNSEFIAMVTDFINLH